jgi:hypothetical protein
MATHPAAGVVDLLAPLLADLANGRISAEARPFFFGAKECGIVKPLPESAPATSNHDLRPIGAGESLRRAAAKLLNKSNRQSYRRVFDEIGQMGIGQPNGQDTIVHACRRLAEDLVEHPDANFVLWDGDVENAHNTCNREIMLQQACEVLPEIGRYTVAAYGAPTLLFFGPWVISSEDGGQQGDPLMGVLWALVFRTLLLEKRELVTQLRFNASFADDTKLGGSLDVVRALVDHIRLRGPHYGIRLNLNKCKVFFCSLESPHRSSFSEFIHHKEIKDLTALNAPVGGPEITNLHLTDLVERARALMTMVATLENSHVAFLLLKHCCAYPVANYLCRLVGPHPRLADFDAAVKSAFSSIAFDLTGDNWDRATLPTKLGGLGLRSADRHSSAAFIASSVASRDLSRHIHPLGEPVGDRRLAAVAADFAAAHPEHAPRITAFVSGEERIAKAQSVFSSYVDNKLFTQVKTLASELDQVAITSSCAKGASAWLNLQPTGCNLNLDNETFLSYLSLRSCVAVTPEARACTLCLHTLADSRGDHSLLCSRSHSRTALHNSLRDCLFYYASTGLLTAHREPHPFPAASGRRVDISFERGGRTELIDVAVHHPRQRGYVRAAIDTPGGAATQYERVKHATYDRLLLPHHTLTGVIVDSYGAWGASSARIIRIIAEAWGRRHGIPNSIASQLVYAKLNHVLVKGVARRLLLNARQPPEAIAARNAPTFHPTTSG